MFRSTEAAACCRLGLVEMIATVARKSRGELIEAETTQRLLLNIKVDFAAFEVLPVDESSIEQASELALKHGLRTIDAIHLAAALSRRRNADTVIMVSSDLELLAASEKEGLAFYNPLAV